MWMSADKRRALAKETSGLPYLEGASKREAELATQIRGEILEQVFDQFIRPDDSDFDASSPSRWNRAMQLWKTLLTEKRVNFFIELKASEYVEWIKAGEPTLLPCTASEIESHNSALPKLEGEKDITQFASEIRATILKSCDAFEQLLLKSGVQAAKRLKLRKIRDVVRIVTDPAWFIKRRPKAFASYKELISSWVESSKVPEYPKRQDFSPREETSADNRHS
jgi:hypothetical protein